MKAKIIEVDPVKSILIIQEVETGKIIKYEGIEFMDLPSLEEAVNRDEFIAIGIHKWNGQENEGHIYSEQLGDKEMKEKTDLEKYLDKYEEFIKNFPFIEVEINDIDYMIWKRLKSNLVFLDFFNEYYEDYYEEITDMFYAKVKMPAEVKTYFDVIFYSDRRVKAKIIEKLKEQI